MSESRKYVWLPQACFGWLWTKTSRQTSFAKVICTSISKQPNRHTFSWPLCRLPSTSSRRTTSGRSAGSIPKSRWSFSDSPSSALQTSESICSKFLRIHRRLESPVPCMNSRFWHPAEMAAMTSAFHKESSRRTRHFHAKSSTEPCAICRFEACCVKIGMPFICRWLRKLEHQLRCAKRSGHPTCDLDHIIDTPLCHTTHPRYEKGEEPISERILIYSTFFYTLLLCSHRQNQLTFVPYEQPWRARPATRIDRWASGRWRAAGLRRSWHGTLSIQPPLSTERIPSLLSSGECFVSPRDQGGGRLLAAEEGAIFQNGQRPRSTLFAGTARSSP
jgi:hypothetical protein